MYILLGIFLSFTSCASTNPFRKRHTNPAKPESLVVGPWNPVCVHDLEWMCCYGRSGFVGFIWISADLGCSVVLRTKIYQNPIFFRLGYKSVGSVVTKVRQIHVAFEMMLEIVSF